MIIVLVLEKNQKIKIITTQMCVSRSVYVVDTMWSQRMCFQELIAPVT